MNPLNSPVDIRPDHLEIVRDILREYLPLDVEVWVFGSRANWTTKDSSDLDLALKSKGKLSYESIGALKDAFEDSPLPYTVDVVDLNRIGDSFRRIVELQKVYLPTDGGRVKKKVNLTGGAPRGSSSLTARFSASSGQWREVAVGDFAPFAYGKSLPARKRNPSGSVPVVGSNGVVGYHDSALTDGPTIVIGRKGTVGVVHYFPTPCWPIDTTFFVTDDDAALMRFKYYALSVLGLDQMNTDSAVPGLNRNAAHARELRVPDESEQRAIARILGTLDDKIELNRRMNETLEGMARALFQSWFVDFEPVRAKMDGRWRRGESLPGLPAEHYDLFPDRLVDSELGEIPEGWDVKPLGEVVEVVGGTTPSTKVSEYWDEGIHCWATPKDLSSLCSPVLLDTERKITDAGLGKIGSGLLPPGTVLLSSRAPIGYLAISEEPVAINQGFIGILLREGMSNLFALYWCEVFHAEIVNHANGSTFLEISKSNFRRIPLVVPAEEVMTSFDRLARTLHEHIVSNERESRALAIQRDALLPKLVSGEVGMTSCLSGDFR